MRFEVDRRRVVHETIDGEAILIHMETGCYYSLGGVGSEIWESLVAGFATEEIAQRLRVRYEAPPGEIEEAVSVLVEELRTERLIEEAAEQSQSGADGQVLDGREPAAAHADFVPPVLYRYTDMADFMLVDPIHEVEESGWPDRKAAH
jgi:hypothetical protein